MNYYQRYRKKLQRGYTTSPRGMTTHASFNEVFSFVPGTCWRRNGDNPAIGFIEGLQFIGGIMDKPAIQAVAPHVDLNLFGPTSFYGIRTIGQPERIIEEIKRDRETRRATMLIANDRDTSETMPCTLSMTWYVVPSTWTINCTVAMRSSDAVWGLPYDMIQFGMMHLAIVNCIPSMLPGPITVNMVNAHIYDSHDGGVRWWKNEFSLPKFSTWDDYKVWAKNTVEFWPERRELEDIFHLKDSEESDIML